MKAICIILFIFVNVSLSGQEYLEIPLYDTKRIVDENTPSIRVYLSDKPNGMAVIACPGGGYKYLEMNKEGYSFAPWFNDRGITFIILKYRLPDGNPEIPLTDAKQAMRLVRLHAKDWSINPKKIGIMGSSAGGHVASTLATHFDNDTRPDFQILLYPVITMDEEFTHSGSFQQLLGENPAKEEIALYSNECQVKAETPPAFIVLSDNDNIVPSTNSIRYYQSLNNNKVPAEMHIYPTGGHGWGMYKNFTYYDQWTGSLNKWLEIRLSDKK
ncbi:alpha/beta hydrolase [Dysgonomonas sp. 520]|uniref:alpha/beta hydrolase n=1 Tax=Dysgonomonas sp. 520 TaxID=2302931 RepID=UPI0013D8AC16